MFTPSTIISGLAKSLVFLAASAHLSGGQFRPPQASVEPLKPVGIRISIPHEYGLALVAFHVKINEEFDGLEAGTFAKDILKPKNGRWTFEDRYTRLRPNDIVYYWINVIRDDGFGFNVLNQRYRVASDFFDYNGERIKVDDAGGNSDLQQCEMSVTTLFNSLGAGTHPCAGHLLFSEDFRDLQQLKRTQWTIVEQFSGSPDFEFVVYQDSRDNLNVRNGLSIQPKLLRDQYDDSFVREGNLTLSKCTGRSRTVECQRVARGWNILPPVTSARINTKQSLNFEYGRVEIRAKFPRGDWLYPLLLLEPVNKNGGSSLETLQIRIASAAGNPELQNAEGVDVSGHVLWGGLTGLESASAGEDRINPRRSTRYSRELWSDRYHVYELLWSREKIVLRVDGERYEEKRVDLPRNTAFYLTVGLAAGGLSEFPDHCVSRDYTKTWRNVEAKALYHFYNTTDSWFRTWQDGATSLDVDYVKIWAL